MTTHNRPARQFAQLALLALLLLSSLGAAVPARARQQVGSTLMPDEKISSGLAAAVAELPGPGLVAVADEPVRDGHVATYNGLIQIIVATTPAQIAAARQAIDAVGGLDPITGPGDETVQVWVPAHALTTLAASPAVLALRLPSYLGPDEPGDAPADAAAGDGPELQLGSVLTQGVSAMNAAPWHSQGVIGRGVKVGVIDREFGNANTYFGTELPQNTVWKDFVSLASPNSFFSGGSTNNHGTQCAMIIADVAPGAQLFLARVSTVAEMAQAVDWMIAQGVKVISMSMGEYRDAPGDGTGPFATFINKAHQNGVLMIVSAGNLRRWHWGGSFTDTDGDLVLDFAPGDEYNCLRLEAASGCSPVQVPAGQGEPRLEIYMRWSDSWSAAKTNLNIYLHRRAPNGAWVEYPLKSSTNAQNGLSGQQPSEYLSYVVTEALSSSPSEFAVRIVKAGSGPTPANIELFVKVTGNAGVEREMTLRYRTPSRSLSVIGAAKNAFTVGAIDVATMLQAPYSAEGPTNGPGDSASGGSVKPDIMGYANVSTTSASSARFHGTSAAAPHVAGAAALVAQVVPGASPTYIRSYLSRWGTSLGAPGKDTVYGAGGLRLGPIPSRNPYDTNRDGRADLFWRDFVNRTNSLMPINENGLVSGASAALPNVELGWRLVGRGDLNGDGLSDAVWRNPSTGVVTAWLMKFNGYTPSLNTSTVIGSASSSWRVMGVADFSGDGKVDILWQSSLGKASIWVMNGASRTTIIELPTVPSGYSLIPANFNGDPVSDLLMRNPTTGANVIWMFDGAKVYQGGTIMTVKDGLWKLLGVADFDGGGKADLLWRHTDGSLSIWFMSGTSLLRTVALGKISTSYMVAGLADVNGDLMADLILHGNTGAVAAVLVDGNIAFKQQGTYSSSSPALLKVVSIPMPANSHYTIVGMLPYVATAAPAVVAGLAEEAPVAPGQEGAEWPVGPAGALPSMGAPMDVSDVIVSEPPTLFAAGEEGTTIYLPALVR